jgi:hypothetical protein
LQRFTDSGAQLAVVDAPLPDIVKEAAADSAQPHADAPLADDGEIQQPEAPAPQVRGRNPRSGKIQG